MTAAVSDEELFGTPEEDVADLLADLPAPLRGPAVFRVDSEGAAVWVVDKLLSYEERQARLNEQYLAMTDALKRDRERFERRFLGELQAWFEDQPKKGKSLRLLTGTLAVRTVRGGPRVVDEAAVFEWAEVDLPDAIKTQTVRKLDKDAVREHVRETGEVVPGVELVPDRESFSVKGPKAPKEDA